MYHTSHHHYFSWLNVGCWFPNTQFVQILSYTCSFYFRIALSCLPQGTNSRIWNPSLKRVSSYSCKSVGNLKAAKQPCLLRIAFLWKYDAKLFRVSFPLSFAFLFVSCNPYFMCLTVFSVLLCQNNATLYHYNVPLWVLESRFATPFKQILRQEKTLWGESHLVLCTVSAHIAGLCL